MTGSKLQPSLVTTARRQVLGHSSQLGRDQISSAKARKPASQPQRETAALCPSLEHITSTN